MRHLAIAWGPAALWAAVLFFLSSWESPGVRTPFEFDKLVHGVLYAVLGVTLVWARLRSTRMPHAAMVLLGVVFGLTDEFHQSFVPGRTASWGDLVADAVGVVLGYSLALWVSTRRLSARTAAST